MLVLHGNPSATMVKMPMQQGKWCQCSSGKDASTTKVTTPLQTPLQCRQRCQPNAGGSRSVTRTVTPAQRSHSCIFYSCFCCHHAALEEPLFLRILLLFHHHHRLLPLLQMVQAFSTVPSPLWSCCHPLSLALYCHHLLRITNIQLGCCCSRCQGSPSLLLPPPFCSISSLKP